MEELLLGILRQVNDGSPSNLILEMGIDSAEGEFLSQLLACTDKSLLAKQPLLQW
jgi:hypothetical protein